MKPAFTLSAVAVAVILHGCQSQQQMVNEMQPDALQVAKQRGKFELNCPSATATVISNEMIQSEIVNPRWAPPQRAQSDGGEVLDQNAVSDDGSVAILQCGTAPDRARADGPYPD